MKEKQSHDFTKKLLTLVFPIAFQQFMLALVSASDALILGMLTQDSLSAVSLAGQITFVENLFLATRLSGVWVLPCIRLSWVILGRMPSPPIPLPIL